MWLVAYLFLVLIFCVYWALSLRFSYWKTRGLPSPPASILFGNFGPSFCVSQSIGQIYSKIYNDFPNLRYVGFYSVRKPGIILRDPELIKDVLIKDFNNFHDTGINIDENVDPIGAKNPFILTGNKWKVVRNQISPAFTSKRLKSMFPLIQDAIQKMMIYLEQTSNSLDAKELSAKFTTEVVANCIFGLEANSFTDTDPEFRKMGRKIFEPSFMNSIKFVIITLVPTLANILKLPFFSSEVIKYFTNVLAETLKYRKENRIIRHDFLDFMLELKNTSEYEFTNDDVLAHCLSFFVDGFETSAATLSFALYELAVNPVVQEKLREAIGSNELTYEAVHSIPYLDGVFNESLRLHPPAMFTSRVCTEEYSLPSPFTENGREIKIDLGTLVVVPTYAIQNDKKYFYEPERFIPERFMESSTLVKKGTFLPFGDGPRNCQGQRFAVTQVKLAIAQITKNFNIKLDSKTKVPLKVDPAYLVLHAQGGIWLEFWKRQ